MPSAHVGKGRYSATGATEQDIYLRPRLLTVNPASRPPIVYCHGSTQAPAHLVGVGGPALPTMVARLVDLGWWVFAADLGPSLTQWANATSMARMVDLVAWAKAVTGWTGAKVHLMASSMGHATATKYAAAHPAQVASITGMIPVTGVQWCRDNNPALRAQIDAAAGVVYPAALPAGYDPFTDPAQIAAVAGLPWQLHAASDDVAAAPLASAEAWAEQVGGEAFSVGALGHTDAAMGAPDPVAIHQFISAHA